MWREITGWHCPYRVNEEGLVQRYWKGKWIDLKPIPVKKSSTRVIMRMTNGKTKRVSLARLVWKAFRGPIPDGMVVGIRNGAKLDCRLENLFLTTREERGRAKRPGNSRPVEKISRSGEVVAIYPSAAAAARANYISETQMRLHCAGRVQDRYHLDGFMYRYEERRIPSG